MATALISLGSNVGNRTDSLRQALALLALVPGVRIAATSLFHETKPAGGPAAQEIFLNAAARLETDLPPRDFFLVLQGIENQLGRVRSERWGPRTIDLDLLLYDQVELDTSELTLPHPRMSFRRFVLEPAAEIAAEMVHPVCGNSIGGLLRHLDQSPRYLAVEGHEESVVAALCQSSRLVMAFEPWTPQSYSSHLARLRKAVGELQRGQWLVGDAWGANDARFMLDDTGWVHSSDSDPSALIQPKLLIVLPSVGSDSIRQIIRHYYRGPVLCLKHADMALIAHEVLAAIAAME